MNFQCKFVTLNNLFFTPPNFCQRFAVLVIVVPSFKDGLIKPTMLGLGSFLQHVQYRKSLTEIGWSEEQIIQCDELALEDQPLLQQEERDRNEKSWVLKFKKEGGQGPMNHRPDFVEVKRLHDEHVKEASARSTPIHHVQRSRQRTDHQFCRT